MLDYESTRSPSVQSCLRALGSLAFNQSILLLFCLLSVRDAISVESVHLIAFVSLYLALYGISMTFRSACDEGIRTNQLFWLSIILAWFLDSLILLTAEVRLDGSVEKLLASYGTRCALVLEVLFSSYKAMMFFIHRREARVFTKRLRASNLLFPTIGSGRYIIFITLGALVMAVFRVVPETDLLPERMSMLIHYLGLGMLGFCLPTSVIIYAISSLPIQPRNLFIVRVVMFGSLAYCMTCEQLRDAALLLYHRII